MSIQFQVRTLHDAIRQVPGRSCHEIKLRTACKTTALYRKFIPVVCTLAILLTAQFCSAQQISGTVLDFDSKAPIYQVKIRCGKESTFTDVNGNFSIPTGRKADTLQISKEGYKQIQYLTTENNRKDKLILQLSRLGISLREVQIRAQERYKADSIRMRKDFSKAFNYKGPGFQELFMARSGENRKSLIRDPNSNSTASIVHVNLLQLGSLLSRNKNSSAKLKKQLLEDEQTKAADQRFSKARIAATTTLSGDSLLLFMNTYRPTPTELQNQSDYELMLYIKRCYSEFIKKAGH
jgi:hypothetical protein